jgi:acyl dehydratase
MSTDQPLATFRVPSVSAEAMRTMAVLHGDPNPIHLDPAAAKAYGLGDRVVNPGGANLGYVFNALATIDPAARVERVSLRFLANVFAEDDVVATAELEGEETQDGRRTLTCAVALDVQGGARALEGTAIVSVPAE